MRVPHLNRALVLERETSVKDGGGGFRTSWEPMGTLWAEVLAGGGTTRDRQSVGISRVDYRITVRAMPFGADARPKAGQRFREGTRVFRILAVAERGTDGRYLNCKAREETAV
ncbi:MAG: head-tail adaptor protein [Cognatishimia sp.]